MDIIFENEVYEIFGAAIDVHKVLGPGFLEAVYQEAFELELSKRGIPFESQKKLQITYKGITLKKEYIADLIRHHSIIIEIKSVKEVAPVHKAQVINYLNITKLPLGLLVNFGSYPKLERYRMVQTKNFNYIDL